VPLLAAWYSFERLASIRRTYEQTIGALSVVPELAGLVRSGHAERVAVLAERLGHELGLHARDLEYLHAATLLHHLGHLCLDDPEVRGAPIESWEVADKGAEILRQTDYLAPAGDLLASDATAIGGQILKVASAFDELTAGDPTLGPAAVEALYSGPGYVYDIRVLAALDRIVDERVGATV
jgi:response regulator RpfG family c-di-GMP phosphodiesterase